MSDTTFSSSGYALPGTRASSLLGLFKDSKLCREASGALTRLVDQTLLYLGDVRDGTKVDRFSAVVAPSTALSALAFGGAAVAATVSGLDCVPIALTAIGAAASGILAFNHLDELAVRGSEIRVQRLAVA